MQSFIPKSSADEPLVDDELCRTLQKCDMFVLNIDDCMVSRSFVQNFTKAGIELAAF